MRIFYIIRCGLKDKRSGTSPVGTTGFRKFEADLSAFFIISDAERGIEVAVIVIG